MRAVLILLLTVFMLHYMALDHGDERNKQLPFKSVNIHHLHHAFVPLSKTIVLKPVCYLTRKIKYPSLNDNDIPDPVSATLFRPPRA